MKQRKITKVKKQVEGIVLEVIGVIGSGRMGRVLAGKLAPHYNLLVYDRDGEKAQEVAVTTGGRATDLEGVIGVPVMILALPAEAIPKAVEELLPYLRTNQLLVNIATTMQKTIIEEILKGRCPVVSAKIIGHAKEISGGEPPMVVIDAPDLALGQRVAAIFRHLGPTVFDQEDVVQRLNVLASTEGIKAALSIEEKMRKAGIPQQYLIPAIRGVAAGTMKAFAAGDAGPFVQALIRQIQGEKES